MFFVLTSFFLLLYRCHCFNHLCFYDSYFRSIHESNSSVIVFLSNQCQDSNSSIHVQCFEVSSKSPSSISFGGTCQRNFQRIYALGSGKLLSEIDLTEVISRPRTISSSSFHVDSNIFSGLSPEYTFESRDSVFNREKIYQFVKTRLPMLEKEVDKMQKIVAFVEDDLQQQKALREDLRLSTSVSVKESWRNYGAILIGLGETVAKTADSTHWSTAPWIHLTKNVLDVTNEENFEDLFNLASIDEMKAEHVFEHLALDEALAALRNCFKFLRPGGRLRIAVPDYNWIIGQLCQLPTCSITQKNLSDPNLLLNAIIDLDVLSKDIQQGHFLQFDVNGLMSLVESVGFQAVPLEWTDKQLIFHRRPWFPSDGMIDRSSQGNGTSLSLMVDAVVPLDNLSVSVRNKSALILIGVEGLYFQVNEAIGALHLLSRGTESMWEWAMPLLKRHLRRTCQKCSTATLVGPESSGILSLPRRVSKPAVELDATDPVYSFDDYVEQNICRSDRKTIFISASVTMMKRVASVGCQSTKLYPITRVDNLDSMRNALSFASKSLLLDPFLQTHPIGVDLFDWYMENAAIIREFKTLLAERLRSVYPNGTDVVLTNPYLVVLGGDGLNQAIDLINIATSGHPVKMWLIVLGGRDLDDMETTLLIESHIVWVQIPEPVPSSTRRVIFSGAHAFVVTHHVNDSYPIILEAAASGCPVVLPLATELRRMLTDNQRIDLPQLIEFVDMTRETWLNSFVGDRFDAGADQRLRRELANWTRQYHVGWFPLVSQVLSAIKTALV